VGVIEGGTSINTIAHEAHLLLDLRSEAPAALGQLVAQVEKLVARYARDAQVQVTTEVIGNRPAGAIPRETPLVSWAVAALQQVGAGSQLEFTTGSTDANIPLSRGWPAVCVGLTESGNAHRPDEYMDVTRIPAGMGQLLLLILAAAG
jgi:di/tripeptidase